MAGGVLIVDPDRSAQAAGRMLGAILGVEVSCATAGETALERMRGGDARPVALVAGRRLPGIDGIELIKRARGISPSLAAVLLSDVPAGLSRAARARIGIGRCIVRAGRWEADLYEALAAACGKRRVESALVAALGDGEEGLDSIARIAAALPPEIAAPAIEYLRASRRGVAALDALLEGDLDERVAAALLDPPFLPGPSISGVAALAGRAAAALGLRLRALRHLGARAEEDAVVGLAACVLDRSIWIRTEAAAQIVARAETSDAVAPSMLAGIAAASDLPSEVRRRASEVAAALAPVPAGVAATGAEIEVLAKDAPAESIAPWLDAVAESAIRGGAKTQAALLVAAMRAGDCAASARVLRSLIERDETAPRIRSDAIALHVSRGTAAEVSAIERAFTRGPDSVRATALSAAMFLGDPGAAFATRVAAAENVAEPLRVRALRWIAAARPRREAVPAMAACLRSPARGVAAAAAEVGMRLYGAASEPVIEVVEASGDPGIQNACLDGAMSLGEAGFEPIAAIAARERFSREVRARALAYLCAAFPEEELGDLAARVRKQLAPVVREAPVVAQTPGVPEAVAVPVVPAVPAVHAAEVPVSPDEADTAPMEPARAPLRITPANVARARLRLQQALERGPDGRAELTAMAESATVPEEVRAVAARQLTSIEVQEEAPPTATLASLSDTATSLANTPGARVRALRHIAAHHPKSETRALFESLLGDPIPDVRRAALDGIFPSLRHTRETALEKTLINLLVEHPQDDLKSAAATALGVYGGARSVNALLDHARGLLKSGELKHQAREALRRIAARDPQARALLLHEGELPQ